MRKSRACEIASRRLGLSLKRVEALVQRVAEAGLLPLARGSERLDLSAAELSRLLLSAACDRGLGNAARSVTEFEALQTDSGIVLGDVITNIVDGLVAPAAYAHGGLIFRLRPAAATFVFNDSRLHFGGPPPADSANKSVTVPGEVLAAIAYEFRGYTPSEADDEVAKACGVRPIVA